MRTLRQCLLDTDPVLLRVIATRWGIDPTGLKPRDLVAQVESAIGDPARASQMSQILSSAEREALRSLLSAGGVLPAPNFSQRFGSIRPVGPARLEREQPWRSPVSPAEGLWYLGLIYKGFEQLPNGAMREAFFAPSELAPLLLLLKAAELPIEPLALAPIPDRVHSSGDSLADDLCTLISHLHNNFVRLQGNSIRSAVEPTRNAIAPYLRDGDPDRINFMLHLAYRARLLKSDPRRLRPDPRPAADWLRASTLDQLRILFEAWRAAAEWNDLQLAHTFQIERAGSWRGDPVAIRSVILDTLRAAVPNAWHTFDALAARMKSQSPDFARSDFDTDYIRDAASGEYLRGFAAWDLVEGALIRAIIAGPLHWLGAIDLGLAEKSDQPAAFRLTPVGAALLGLEADLSIPPQPLARFLAQTDATISISAARRYDRFQLARIADLVGVTRDEYRYRLSPSSLARAASQRISAAKVIEFLSQAGSLPPSLIKAIERWAAQGAEIRIERTVIVRVKDAALLKRLQDSPRTRSLVVEVLGPRAARINQRDWPRLIAVLAEQGLLVDVNG